MLLNDAFQDGRRAGAVPDAIGIDDGDGALEADAEAVGFRAVNQRLGAGEVKFFQTALQIFPGFQTLLFGAAFWVSLVGAEEDVAFEFCQT